MDVTMDTRIADLPLSPRLRVALKGFEWRLGINYEDLKVGDILAIPSDQLRLAFMQFPNVGKKSVTEWEDLTDHLRGIAKIGPPRNESERLHRMRVALRTIGGAHKHMAAEYQKLADLVFVPED